MTASALGGCAAGRDGQPARLDRPPGYALVFADEFDSPGAPAPPWRFDTSRNAVGWYNHELQYYAGESRTNGQVADGRLVIEARREALAAAPPADWGGQRYTSARLTTLGAATWRYGYFEVRAKLPCVRGAWPAIWLLPEDTDRTGRHGEIDIAEVVGQTPGQVHHAVHILAPAGGRGSERSATSPVDLCGGFHDYQLLWTPERIAIAVDGRIGLIAPGRDADQPMGLILNVAVGGSWAGREGIDDAALPARMEIEHVRVWQQPPQG